ncbi:hypothetical protein AURDEDRAFT_173783 [Auricularia subglabra TFB-10046 SS5]|nr:hypothetical protein AURDEDRAFT_173783 [Auricularia subglabra TFB-10046 SS5]
MRSVSRLRVQSLWRAHKSGRGTFDFDIGTPPRILSALFHLPPPSPAALRRRRRPALLSVNRADSVRLSRLPAALCGSRTVGELDLSPTRSPSCFPSPRSPFAVHAALITSVNAVDLEPGDVQDTALISLQPF